MQILVDIISQLWNKPWFSEVLIILFFSSIMLWNKVIDSERYLRWRVNKNPSDFDAHMNLGSYLSGIEDCLEEAEDEFQQAFLLNPQDKGASYQLFLVQEKLKKNDLAEDTLTRLLRNFPEDADVNICAGNFYSEKNINLSEEYYKKSVSIAPGYYFGLQNYGVFLNRLKRYSEAEEFLKRALHASPFNKFVDRILIINLLQQKKYAEVEINASKFLEHTPIDNDVRWLLGIALNSQNKTKEAIKIFEEILRRDPKYEAAYNDLGTIYFFAEDYVLAEKKFRQVIEINPDDAWYYFALGEVLDALKRYEEAIHYYEIAVSIDPNDIGATISLACLYRFLEDQKNSSIFLEKARQIVKNDDWYNLSCIESINGNLSQSFVYLRNSVDEGDFDFKRAWKDRDLQWIRDDPRFLEIVGPKPE